MCEAGLRSDVTPDAVVALRSAADNMPLAHNETYPWYGAAKWLRRRADAFEVAIALAAPPPPGRPVERTRGHEEDERE